MTIAACVFAAYVAGNVRAYVATVWPDGWRDWSASLVAVGFLACLVIIVPPCAVAETRFQIVECQPDLPCRFRGASLSSETACGLDAASLAFVVPSGTRIKCVRVDGLREVETKP